MQHRVILPCLVVGLVLLSLVSANVYADSLQITSVSVPSSVGAGQALTVVVTISYFIQTMAGEGLALMILQHTEMGNAYTLTSGSANCYIPSYNPAVCFITASDFQGTVTVSVTLNAPQTVGLWRPSVIVAVTSSTANMGSLTVIGSTFKVLTITVTNS